MWCYSNSLSPEMIFSDCPGPKADLKQIQKTSSYRFLLHLLKAMSCHKTDRGTASLLQILPWRPVCLINDKATLSSLRANLSLAALGKNLLLSILLHAFAACQALSWLWLWSFGISCEAGITSWEGWCAPCRRMWWSDPERKQELGCCQSPLRAC